MAAPFCREGGDFSPSPVPVKDIDAFVAGATAAPASTEPRQNALESRGL